MKRKCMTLTSVIKHTGRLQARVTWGTVESPVAHPYWGCQITPSVSEGTVSPQPRPALTLGVIWTISGLVFITLLWAAGPSRQVGNLRPIVNRLLAAVESAQASRLTIGRRIPSCPA